MCCHGKHRCFSRNSGKGVSVCMRTVAANTPASSGFSASAGTLSRACRKKPLFLDAISYVHGDGAEKGLADSAYLRTVE